MGSTRRQMQAPQPAQVFLTSIMSDIVSLKRQMQKVLLPQEQEKSMTTTMKRKQLLVMMPLFNTHLDME